MCLSYFVRADGIADLPLRSLIVANVANIIFDLIFIGVFGWGLSGAAGATIVGYILGSIYMLTYFFNPKRTLNFVFVKLKTFLSTTAAICKSEETETFEINKNYYIHKDFYNKHSDYFIYRPVWFGCIQHLLQ